MSDEDRNENQDSPASPEDIPPAEVEYEAHLDDEFSEPEDYTLPPVERSPGPDPSELEALRRERDEMRAQYEKIEPFFPLLNKPEFREWLEERMAVGDEAVPRHPAPTEADIVETRLIKASPEYQTIHEAVVEWAQTLPAYQREELDNNHAAYNAAYKKFAAIAAGRLPAPAPPPAAYQNVPRDAKALEASVKAKEVQREISKILARVEPPGAALQDPVPEDPQAAYRAAKKRLDHVRQYGTPAQVEEAELDLIRAHWGDEDKPKRKTGINW